jgi:methionyl-tRNA synthetase
MIENYRGGVVPDAKPDAGVAEQFEGLLEDVMGSIDRTEVSAALEAIWTRVRELNRFVQENEPWKLSKDASAADRLDEVLYTLAEGLRVVSVLLLAVLPDRAERLLAAFGAEERQLDCAKLGAVGGGAKLGDLGQLVPRVEPPKAA